MNIPIPKQHLNFPSLNFELVTSNNHYTALVSDNSRIDAITALRAIQFVQVDKHFIILAYYSSFTHLIVRIDKTIAPLNCFSHNIWLHFKEMTSRVPAFTVISSRTCTKLHKKQTWLSRLWCLHVDVLLYSTKSDINF